MRIWGWLIVTGGLFAVAILAIGSAMICEASLRLRRVPPPSLAAVSGRYPGANWKEVRIEAQDGIGLDAYFVRAKSQNCVVILHGIADSRASASGFAPMFLPEGYSLLIPDIRGHGTSGGDLMTFGVKEKQDLLLWTRWLQRAGCERIYGLGESLGGAILIQAAAIEPAAFRAIVAECPFADLQTIAEYRVGQRLPTAISGWAGSLLVAGSLQYARARYGLDLSEASPVRAIARSKTPILLIHGLADSATPPSHSRELAAAAGPASLLWLVPGAAHVSASSTAPEEFRRRVLGWFSTNHDTTRR